VKSEGRQLDAPHPQASASPAEAAERRAWLKATKAAAGGHAHRLQQNREREA